MAADDLGGSLYLNYQLGALVEIPSSIIGIIACNRIGRKKTTIIHVFILGISCIIVAIIPNSGTVRWGRVFFGILGKYGIALGFDAIYTWSAELYPTRIRSTGMGFCQVMARIGGTCSPWVAKGLKVIHHTVPFLTMGFLGLLATFLMFWLPETKDISEDERQRRDSLVAASPLKEVTSDVEV